MAIITNRQFPIDLNARKAVGFGFPLNGNAVFKATYTTRDQIKSNLINWFLTNKGERVFNPDFGANLRSKLFESITDGNLVLLEKQLQEGVANNFPNVLIGDLKILKNEDYNSFKIEFTYSIVNFGITDNINIIIN
jgi:phage baseplate assembly protein W